MADQLPAKDAAVPVGEIPCGMVDDDVSGAECGQPSTHAIEVRVPRQDGTFYLLACQAHARGLNYLKREFLDVTDLPPDDETA